MAVYVTQCDWEPIGAALEPAWWLWQPGPDRSYCLIPLRHRHPHTAGDLPQEYISHTREERGTEREREREREREGRERGRERGREEKGIEKEKEGNRK